MILCVLTTEIYGRVDRVGCSNPPPRHKSGGGQRRADWVKQSIVAYIKIEWSLSEAGKLPPCDSYTPHVPVSRQTTTTTTIRYLCPHSHTSTFLVGYNILPEIHF